MIEQDEVLRMAREAGWEDLREFDAEMRDEILIGNAISLERFAALVAEATRNDIADFIEHGHSDDEKHNIQYAQSIRSIK